jgi:hypothetical protein
VQGEINEQISKRFPEAYQTEIKRQPINWR